MKNTSEYYQALIKCADRYQKRLDEYWSDCVYWGFEKTPNSKQVDDLRNFVRLLKDSCNQNYPLMKLNRWLGYIQGTMISWGLTTVETERDWSRSLFKHLDFYKRVEYDEASGRWDDARD